jgi:hypothetical protein
MTLYPRQSHQDDLRARAHQILDDAKAGLTVSDEQITWALRITGDLT